METEPPRALGRAAFLAASFLSLFLEVLLIRWCGAEIRILAYLKNLTLLGCFLGLGLGYAACSRRRLGLGWTFLAVFVLVALAHPELGRLGVPSFRALSTLLNFSDMNTWKDRGSDALQFFFGLALLSGLYAILAFAFVPIGQALGQHFQAVPKEQRIREYTWNVVASLLGIAAFGALSLLEAPPLLWFLVGSASALLAASAARERVLVLGFTALVSGLLVLADHAPPSLEGDVAPLTTDVRVIETRWSPYQKIQLVREHHAFERPVPGAGPKVLEWDDHSAYVNGHWYSRVGTVDLEVAQERATYAQNPGPYVNQLLLRLPYRLARGRGAVLLLGAGMGRDAATAVAEGMQSVDVVEIEPRFITWGKELHPQKPYTDEQRVHVHVDDARRFVRNATPARYDLIVFCYLDSHALTSNFTNTNLDSYVYTRESLAEAKRLLAPNGVLALGFWSPRRFIYQRMERLFTETFGAPPLRLGGDGSLFMAGLEGREVLEKRAREEPLLAKNLVRLEGGEVRPTTDDWPFLYLEKASVPNLFLAVLLAIGLLSAVGVGTAVGRVARVDAHFLLLGAAFMLVETWAISRASLVYGATWYVSSAVIASLLTAVLLANARVERTGPARFERAFPLLLGTLVLATVVDPSRLLDLPRAAQLLLAAPLYALPFFFAATIFATSFARAERPDEALASNLLGSVLGGALECLSFATGLRSLGLVALGLYALAWVAARRRS